MLLTVFLTLQLLWLFFRLLRKYTTVCCKLQLAADVIRSNGITVHDSDHVADGQQSSLCVCNLEPCTVCLHVVAADNKHCCVIVSEVAGMACQLCI